MKRRFAIRGLILCAMLGIVSPGVFAQENDEPFALVQPYSIQSIAGGRTLRAGARDFIPNINYVIKDLSGELDAQKGKLAADLPAELRAMIPSLTFLYAIQVQRPVDGNKFADITDFGAIPAPSGSGFLRTVFGVHLTFPRGTKAPERLLMIGDKNPTQNTVALDTHGDIVNARGYHVTLARQELPDKTVVLIIHVYSWPAGDPRMSG